MTRLLPNKKVHVKNKFKIKDFHLVLVTVSEPYSQTYQQTTSSGHPKCFVSPPVHLFSQWWRTVCTLCRNGDSL